jgi:hypothetical protein
MRPAIVIPAFNRPPSLARLLSSVSRAVTSSKPCLILSLEGGATPEVESIAHSFVCDKFSIRIIRRERRLGLRDHVIACGDLTEEYGSIIVLEDDLYVDPYFYAYAESALAYYVKDSAVAGISLYAYSRNEFSNLPFSPMENGYSTYFMQVVSSWGQCWTHDQWQGFKSWYQDKNADYLSQISRLPRAVKSWPESSWKKYFHGYIIDLCKYFVYPYSSYTTNCSDEGGTHIESKSTLHQVALPSPSRPSPVFEFCPPGEKEVVYDSFMEPAGLYVARATGLALSEVECDLQGMKPVDLLKETKYVITFRQVRDRIKSYAYDFRPHEANLSCPLDSENSAGAAFSLALSANILDKSAETNGIARYSYYAGMSLVTKDIAPVYIRTLCMKLLGRLLAKLSSALSFARKYK